jgi:hypothetical protein
MKEEELDFWVLQFLDFLHDKKNQYIENLSPTEKINIFLSNGFPKELFCEPFSLFFYSKVSVALANRYIDDIFNAFVLQANISKENSNGIFVRFMRSMTWQSMENYILRLCDRASTLETFDKNNLPKIPFWFRNFNSKNMKEFLIDTILTITNTILNHNICKIRYNLELSK